MLPGFVPPACNQRVPCEQGRSVRFKRKLVGPDKPTRRERSDDLAEVRLADSTPRSGEPATWGSGQRELNCSRATWAPSNGRSGLLCKEKNTPTMETGLERIAAKARCEPKLRFTSLAHHITRERVWTNLCQIPNHSAPGVDGQTVTEAKESFEAWIGRDASIRSPQGYRAPDIRRVYIPKPGKQEKRPLGVPTVSDRALQRSAAQVLSAIYEQDFLPCSFGGRPGQGAHHALATLNEVIAGSKVGWVLEADLKNFFGSLEPRLVAPVCRAPSRRPAPDQPDPALVESRRPGRRRATSEREGNPARWIDQRVAEQCVSALCARPVVRAGGQASPAGRSPPGAVHR